MRAKYDEIDHWKLTETLDCALTKAVYVAISFYMDPLPNKLAINCLSIRAHNQLIKINSIQNYWT